MPEVTKPIHKHLSVALHRNTIAEDKESLILLYSRFSALKIKNVNCTDPVLPND